MGQDYYPSGPFLGKLPDKGEFDVAREDFLLGFKENTARAYKADLEDWWEWCSEERVDPLRPSEEDVERYVSSLGRRGYSPGTVGRRTAALNGLIRCPPDRSAGREGSPTMSVATDTILRSHAPTQHRTPRSNGTSDPRGREPTGA
jgi:hypothetical protein